ncbi:MAG TPA: cyclic nucleotide-binding domain-containing protein [Nitrososphaerales archaeon]|nr:cyclic nucleotide-binding domain-containing protein [Nitrososphaerales archaeon]
MSKESQRELLDEMRSVPLFSGLKEKQLKSILSSGKQKSYPAGSVIEKEGEDGVAFYLVLEGRVEVRRKGRVLANLGAGDFFGEMSLLDKIPRSSDVAATVPTTCLVVPIWNFRALVRSNGDIAMNVLKTLSMRLRESNKALSE